MIDIDDNIVGLQLKMKIDKYNNMLENVSEDELIDYITDLKNKELNVMKQEKTVNVQQPTEHMIDVSIMYKKPWNKLQNIHRSQKIEEFLTNIKEISDEKREIFMKKITKLLNDRIITKKNEVVYDDKNGKVISIKRLEFNKQKNKYELNC